MILPRRLTELLGDPHYLRLWLIGVLSMGARWLELLVVGVFAVETTGSPVLVALLVILRMLPLAVFGSIVGTFADPSGPAPSAPFLAPAGDAGVAGRSRPRRSRALPPTGTSRLRPSFPASSGPRTCR